MREVGARRDLRHDSTERGVFVALAQHRFCQDAALG